MREEARERASSLIYTGMECLPVCTRNTHTHTQTNTHRFRRLGSTFVYIYIYTIYHVQWTPLCTAVCASIGTANQAIKEPPNSPSNNKWSQTKNHKKENQFENWGGNRQSNVPAAPEKTLASPSSYNVHFHVARTVDGKKLLCCLHNGCKIMKIPTILNKQAGLSHADSGWYFLLPRPFFEFKHPPVALTCKCHALSTYFNHRKQRKKQQE